ncbi:glutamate-1-semialdehyde 2,1-aminomutase [Sulfobacillus harzensis]|uniref:Glutamate-1-semialdehyde 2,1-aminomutase n=1 Tax=Sulfobacillus harzensis TaxID=2729629 RepID=A0A7Y0Q3E5_9FIRM|nr:glutamate-1-semialdehyde 2,1-aminomutase [Sulfobacillus harzensis]NMP22114.1 glutamate-1-semialdehyde 2,1-aminomutase [Sulfobacillus harzensis]
MTENSGWWARAQEVLPGGVNSPVRSFRGVGGEPFFVDKGEGAYLVSDQGKRYCDYVMGYGPLILGHAHPQVVEAVRAQALLGLSYGTPTHREVLMGERIRSAIASMELVRLVNSGTEATMSALRVARGVTGRRLVVKFTGSYHGHHDSLIIKAGSGAATLGVPDSAGVPEEIAQLTMTVPYNDIDALREVFREHGRNIAAVIAEPVAGNMGTVPPVPGFLETIRELTQEYGALWVSDEVMTGFRVTYGSVAESRGLEPDLITLAKVIGAGMPVGAYGGKRQYMELVAPLGAVYQAGTFSGNAVAMAAGLAQLSVVGEPHFYETLTQRTTRLAEGLKERARRHGIEVSVNQAGAMMTLFFNGQSPTNFDEVAASDHERYRRFFHGMLERGIFFPPSGYETCFPSWAHTDADIDMTVQAADAVFRQL